ncbi:hypothetical protein BH18ACI3_BH18ACI3_18670 [soil metagenome]
MGPNLGDTIPIAVAEKTGKTIRSERIWAFVAAGWWSGSVICFFSGLVLWGATKLAVVPTSSVAARFELILLLAAFALAFLGADAADRLSRVRGENSQFK